nr:serpin B8-like [Cherax quadricarinatus]
MMRWVAVASVALVTIAVATTGKTSVSNCFTEKRRISGGFQTDLSGINGFGFDLYRQFSFKNTVENVFFSPYSIWASLALSYFGSAGNTKTQLEAKLGLTDKTSTLKLWRALEMVYAQRAIKNPHYTFSMASRVYFNNNLHLRPCITSIFYKELQSVDFSNSLKNLGINDLFNISSANLTDFVVHEVLSVSKTIHKAFVEVSEEGTEAAAATGQIGYTRFGFGKPRNNFLKFHCNRPFLFLIFDNQMKNVLFMGAYKHPAGDTRKGGSVFENQTLAQIQKGK